MDLPRLQNSLVDNNDFPDFTEGLVTKPATAIESIAMTNKDPLMSEMTIQDFAAIMWKKPVSNRQWLNDLITKQ
jgi:hypothetical protein